MKRNLCTNIFKVLLITMLTLCMVAVLSACQSKKKLSLNNYNQYVSVQYDPTLDHNNEHLIIVDYVVIQKANEDDILSDVTIKCSYVINDYEGEFTEYLGDLDSTYRKQLELPENIEESNSHGGHVTVLKISGTAQRSIYFHKVAPLLGTGALLLFAFVILGIFITNGSKFSTDFKKIQTGMSYREVIEILGEPTGISNVDNISTCVWNIPVIRGWTMVRTITFKDDTVISITD